MAHLSSKLVAGLAILSFVGCSQAQSQDSRNTAAPKTETPAPVVKTASSNTGAFTSTFGTLVDSSGKMTLPDNYRDDWTMIGAWSIAGEDEAEGIHLVYTQPGVAAKYRETGSFPDVAVLVKELLSTNSGDYTTGHVSYAGDVAGWFMMVKDAEKRYPDNQLWGIGWGWSYFDADDTKNTTTENYYTECKGCHVPARKNDWVFTEAYPVLK